MGLLSFLKMIRVWSLGFVGNSDKKPGRLSVGNTPINPIGFGKVSFCVNHILAAGLLFVMAFALSGCDVFGSNTVTRNIRVIVQAEVDGKIVEGSAVMGIRWRSDGKQGGRMYINTNNEAVILEIPSKGTVYVLDTYMTSNGRSNVGFWHNQILKSFDMKGNGQLSDLPKLRALEGRYPVKPIIGRGNLSIMPVMVSFRDETRRETMFEVKPVDFPKVLGARYVGMWFEFTEDEPTAHIPERIPVALKPNKSFYTAFPKHDSNGNRLSSASYAFPQKIGAGGFYHRIY